MAQIDNGPASGNSVLFLGNPPTASVEVHTPLGANSLEPSRAPFIDPGQVGTNITGAQVTPINTTFVFGNTGATIRFANPA